VQNLLDTLNPNRFIPAGNVYIAVTGIFGPTPVGQVSIGQLALGDTAECEVWVHLPYGTRAGAYKGQVQVQDDDGWPSDVIGVLLTVEPYYDLDISDNEQNLVGNTLILAGEPGDVREGRFLLINPNTPELNRDPDLFGNADLTGLTYNVSQLVSGSNVIDPSYVFFPGAPVELATGGYAYVTLRVTIPADQPAGIYYGKVWVSAAEGPADTFDLMVLVGPVEYFTLSGELCDTVYHGVMASDEFMIKNVGNAPISNFVFEATDLTDGNGHYIFDENISFVPPNIGWLDIGDSAFVVVNVWVPLGTHEGRYTGLVVVKDDDGYPIDTLSICVTVLPSYDLDISDNTGNLVGNVLTMHIAPPVAGGSGEGVAYFVLVNPNNADLNVDPDPFGNADLGDLGYVVDDLVHVSNPLAWMPSSVVSFEPVAPFGLVSGGSVDVVMRVNVPYAQVEGEYRGWVRVVDGVVGVRDSFMLRVFVGVNEDIDIVEDGISGSGGAGDTLVFVGRFMVVNPDESWNPDPDGPGNVDLYNLRFAVQNLLDTLNPNRFIPAGNVYIAVTG
ncbi:MAG: hypothetical protein RMJ65_07055, partial [candidate division WOR-3 bacterium]|nr:hypothetical protein [candidate division WOR-3 bacterium]